MLEKESLLLTVTPVNLWTKFKQPQAVSDNSAGAKPLQHT